MPGVSVTPTATGTLYGWAVIVLTLVGLSYLVLGRQDRAGRRFSPRDIVGLVLLAAGAVCLGLYLSTLD